MIASADALINVQTALQIGSEDDRASEPESERRQERDDEHDANDRLDPLEPVTVDGDDEPLAWR